MQEVPTNYLGVWNQELGLLVLYRLRSFQYLLDYLPNKKASILGCWSLGSGSPENPHSILNIVC